MCTYPVPMIALMSERKNRRDERENVPVHVQPDTFLVGPDDLSVLVPAEDQRVRWISVRVGSYVPEAVMFPGVDIPVGVRHRDDIEVLSDSMSLCINICIGN